MRKLIFLIKKYLKFTITIGVGRSQSGYSGIRTSYLEALEALQNKFVLGNDRVIVTVQVCLILAAGALPTEVNEELFVQLRMHNAEKVEDKLEESFPIDSGAKAVIGIYLCDFHGSYFRLLVLCYGDGASD